MRGESTDCMAVNDKPTSITSVLQRPAYFIAKEFSKRWSGKIAANIGNSTMSPSFAGEVLGKQAKNELVWFKPFKKVLQWKDQFAKWFIGGQLNVSYNCLDRHLGTATANRRR